VCVSLRWPLSYSLLQVIGVFAGVPTAVFHQLSFLQTLKKRGEPIRGWIPGATPSLRNMLRCRVPGLLPAIARDVCYLAATQKQVQNASPALSEAALCWFLVVAAPIFFDTLSVKAVTPGYNRPKLTSLKGWVTIDLWCTPVHVHANCSRGQPSLFVLVSSVTHTV
jgi:hypothetical protein